MHNYPAIRMGYSNTHSLPRRQDGSSNTRSLFSLSLFIIIFFSGHLPETSCFRLAKQRRVKTFSQHKHYFPSVSADSPKSS